MDALDAYFRRELGVRLRRRTLAEVRRVAGERQGDDVAAEVRGTDLITGEAKTVLVVLAELPA